VRIRARDEIRLSGGRVGEGPLPGCRGYASCAMRAARVGEPRQFSACSRLVQNLLRLPRLGVPGRSLSEATASIETLCSSVAFASVKVVDVPRSIGLSGPANCVSEKLWPATGMACDRRLLVAFGATAYCQAPDCVPLPPPVVDAHAGNPLADADKLYEHPAPHDW
jgi:hypothetical protein